MLRLALLFLLMALVFAFLGFGCVAALAFEGAKLRYEKGSGDFLTLLETQRTMYAARDQFAQYRLARLQALVSLCKALGGGWEAASADRQSQQAGTPAAAHDRPS